MIYLTVLLFFLFADDLNLYANVSNLRHSILIHKDLSVLGEWCNIHKLSFNVKKFYHISYSHSLDPVLYKYYIRDIFLNRVLEVKDLGVIFDSKFDFETHINFITEKA